MGPGRKYIQVPLPNSFEKGTFGLKYGGRGTMPQAAIPGQPNSTPGTITFVAAAANHPRVHHPLPCKLATHMSEPNSPQPSLRVVAIGGGTGLSTLLRG